MAKYRVQKQFWSWEETIVEADSFDDAFNDAYHNWQELPVEGVGDYEPTGKWLVVDDATNEEREM
jgi:hypothetical protein